MTITIADGMPVLSYGGHEEPAKGACLMEYISLLAGEEFSDTPKCTDFMLALCAQTVNDRIGGNSAVLNALRAEFLLPLVPRLMGTATAPQYVMKKVAEDLYREYKLYRFDLSPLVGTDRTVATGISMWVAVVLNSLASSVPAPRAQAARYAGVLKFILDRYEVHMGDIGEPVRRIEVIPVPEPNEAPVQEPSPQIAPSTPAPEREPVPV